MQRMDSAFRQTLHVWDELHAAQQIRYDISAVVVLTAVHDSYLARAYDNPHVVRHLLHVGNLCHPLSTWNRNTPAAGSSPAIYLSPVVVRLGVPFLHLWPVTLAVVAEKDYLNVIPASPDAVE